MCVCIHIACENNKNIHTSLFLKRNKQIDQCLTKDEEVTIPLDQIACLAIVESYVLLKEKR